ATSALPHCPIHQRCPRPDSTPYSFSGPRCSRRLAHRNRYSQSSARPRAQSRPTRDLLQRWRRSRRQFNISTRRSCRVSGTPMRKSWPMSFGGSASSSERSGKGGQRRLDGDDMTEHTYKHIELTGSSTMSSDDAIKNAIAQAAKTIRNLHWFQVSETRGHITDGKVAHSPVTVKVGFPVEGCRASRRR